MARVIRGVFDGKVARPLPGEPIPDIQGEVEVEIVLAKPCETPDPVAELFRIRANTPPLPFPTAELVRLSREHEEDSD
ncbi:MAG: hypothetical protein ACK4ME_02640 [Fimbriimonadales bacterium]